MHVLLHVTAAASSGWQCSATRCMLCVHGHADDGHTPRRLMKLPVCVLCSLGARFRRQSLNQRRRRPRVFRMACMFVQHWHVEDVAVRRWHVFASCSLRIRPRGRRRQYAMFCMTGRPCFGHDASCAAWGQRAIPPAVLEVEQG